MKNANHLSKHKVKLFAELQNLELTIIKNTPRTFSDFSKKDYPFFRRKSILDSLFKFTEKQINDLLRINRVLLNEMNELYDEMILVKQDIDDMIKNGKVYYKNYCIVGQICIQIPERNKLQYAIRIEFDESAWWRLYMKEHTKNDKISDLKLDVNWNKDLLEFTKTQDEYICYPFYCLAQSDKMSFQDIVRIKNEEVSRMISINCIK